MTEIFRFWRLNRSQKFSLRLPAPRKILKSATAHRIAINLWPPLWGAGIQIKDIHPDFRTVKVTLKDKLFNRNYVGTHFGGSLFAMTDPFFMLMVIKNVGSRYYVWDKAGHIEFVKPGKGLLTAEMKLSEADLEEILQATAQGHKFERDFVAEVRNTKGELVARVTKRVYVRLKSECRPEIAA